MPLPPRYVREGGAFNEGGMSDAILCRDVHLDRLVVVKSLKAGIEPKRILDELAALQTIRSKHVVQIYDVIRDKKGAVNAIVEEFLPGVDLTEVPAPSTTDDYLRLLYPIAEGIADIHEHERVHRDIKRQNMKYDAENCLKIFDFGLSRAINFDASTIGAVGTPGYMAPELFRPNASGRVTFTPAVDTYAFGATALALVLGALPKEMRQTPPNISSGKSYFGSLPVGLPIELIHYLDQCLHVLPNSRPAMQDIANVIGLHLLRNRHRALLATGGKTYILDKSTRTVTLSVKGQGTLDINYDGIRFILNNVTGDVAVNNMSVSNGDILPGSCVIVLGASDLGRQRTMVTVDVSHPEVAL